MPEIPSGRIAYVGPDRQVHVMDPDGGNRRQVTYSRTPAGLAAWGVAAGTDARAWPCWSPDGRWLSCFELDARAENGPAAVVAVQVDGIEERLLVELDDALPIYAQWNATSDRLAILVQGHSDLRLLACRIDDLGHRHVVEEGIPLFFTWTPQGEQLLVHAGPGRAGPSRLVVRDPEGAGPGHLFPKRPGSFCTPMYLGDWTVFFAETELQGESSLCLADAHGRSCMQLGTWHGLCSLVRAPTGPLVAVTSAPGGEGTPYQGLDLVDTHSSERRRLLEGDLLAFLWTPDATRVVVASFDEEQSRIQLDLVDVPTGARLQLGAAWPSRDQLFFLHFFEQYATSHPAISPDGRYLVFSSFPDPSKGRGGPATPFIHLVDLHAPTPTPRVLCEGSFAVFSPG